MSYPPMYELFRKLENKLPKTENDEDSTMRELEERYTEHAFHANHRSRPLSAKIIEKRTGPNFRPKNLRPTSAKKSALTPVKRQETYLNSRIRPNPAAMDKERLYDENMSLKMQINAYKAELINTKTRLKQLEKENKRQNEEIEEISSYDKTPAHKYIRLTNALRKNIKDLRVECKQRDEEIVRLKKHIKTSKISELEVEILTLRDECLRLKNGLEEVFKRKTPDAAVLSSEAKHKDLAVLKKDKTDLSALIRTLQEENKKLKDKLMDAHKPKSPAKDLNKTLKLEIQKLKLQMESCQKEFTDKESNFKHEIVKLRKIEEDLKVSLDQHQQTIIALSQQLRNREKKAHQENLEYPPVDFVEKSSESRSQTKTLHPAVQLSEVSQFLKHIYLSMQLHRLQIDKLPDVLLSKFQEPETKIPVAGLKKMFPIPPFAFVKNSDLQLFYQFLAQPEEVEFLEARKISSLMTKPTKVVKKIMKNVPNWKIFENQEESEFDNELAQLVRGKKEELLRNCLQYDKDQTGIIDMKDFKLALKDSKLIVQPRLFEYITLLFYSHEYQIEKVPYKNFVKAYGESPESEVFIDEEKLQQIKSCLSQIAQSLIQQRLTVREVFKSSDSLIYPESFIAGLDLLGIKSVDQETIMLVLEQLQYDNETETCILLEELEKIMESLGVSLLKVDKKSLRSFESRSSEKSSKAKKLGNDSEIYEYSIDSPDKYGISEISPFGSVSNTDLHGKSSPTVNDYSKIDLEQINDEESDSGSGGDMQKLQFSPDYVRVKENFAVKRQSKKKKRNDEDSSEGEGKTLEYSMTVVPNDKSDMGFKVLDKTEDLHDQELIERIGTEKSEDDERIENVEKEKKSESEEEEELESKKMSAKELDEAEKVSENYSSFEEYACSDEERSYKFVNFEAKDEPIYEGVVIAKSSSPVDTYDHYLYLDEEKNTQKVLEIYSEKMNISKGTSEANNDIRASEKSSKTSGIVKDLKESANSKSNSSNGSQIKSYSSQKSDKNEEIDENRSSRMSSEKLDRNKNEENELGQNKIREKEMEQKESLSKGKYNEDIGEYYGNETFGKHFAENIDYKEEISEENNIAYEQVDENINENALEVENINEPDRQSLKAFELSEPFQYSEKESQDLKEDINPETIFQDLLIKKSSSSSSEKFESKNNSIKSSSKFMNSNRSENEELVEKENSNKSSSKIMNSNKSENEESVEKEKTHKKSQKSLSSEDKKSKNSYHSQQFEVEEVGSDFAFYKQENDFNNEKYPDHLIIDSKGIGNSSNSSKKLEFGQGFFVEEKPFEGQEKLRNEFEAQEITSNTLEMQGKKVETTHNPEINSKIELKSVLHIEDQFQNEIIKNNQNNFLENQSKPKDLEYKPDLQHSALIKLPTPQKEFESIASEPKEASKISPKPLYESENSPNLQHLHHTNPIMPNAIDSLPASFEPVKKQIEPKSISSPKHEVSPKLEEKIISNEPSSEEDIKNEVSEQHSNKSLHSRSSSRPENFEYLEKLQMLNEAVPKSSEPVQKPEISFKRQTDYEKNSEDLKYSEKNNKHSEDSQENLKSHLPKTPSESNSEPKIEALSSKQSSNPRIKHPSDPSSPNSADFESESFVVKESKNSSKASFESKKLHQQLDSNNSSSLDLKNLQNPHSSHSSLQDLSQQLVENPSDRFQSHPKFSESSKSPQHSSLSPESSDRHEVEVYDSISSPESESF